MARIVRTRKVRSINWSGIVSLLFVFSVMSFIITSVFAGLENARLTKQVENIKYEVAQKTDKNLEVAREINDMRGYEHIIAKAEEALMDFNIDNIVVVKSESYEKTAK